MRHVKCRYTTNLLTGALKALVVSEDRMTLTVPKASSRFGPVYYLSVLSFGICSFSAQGQRTDENRIRKTRKESQNIRFMQSSCSMILCISYFGLCVILFEVSSILHILMHWKMYIVHHFRVRAAHGFSDAQKAGDSNSAAWYTAIGIMIP